jgi:hypothetical protein
MNPQWTPFNIILQDFTNVTKPHHYCTAQTHENIRIEREASDIFCSIRRSGISCDSRHLSESNWPLHSSVTCISKKIYETRTDEWHTTWINPRVPFLGVDTERDFHRVVSLFHQTYKADKIRSLYLSNGRHYSHTKNLEVITLARENHADIICLPPHNCHKTLRLNKAFMGPLETFCSLEIEK